MFKLTVGDFTLELEVFAEDASNTTRILRESLPLKTTLFSHSMWSGRSAQFALPGLEKVTEIEAPISSVYPGTLVARPDEQMVMIGYGHSECRSELGADYGIRLGELRGEQLDPFLAFLDHMHYVVGDQEVTIEWEEN